MESVLLSNIDKHHRQHPASQEAESRGSTVTHFACVEFAVRVRVLVLGSESSPRLSLFGGSWGPSA